MDFTQPWDFGDVTFIVEGKKIYMNKGVLALSSEVFRAMFTREFKEKKMAEIPLPGKKFDDFLQLMQIVQPVSDKCVDDSNMETLLHLAHEYQIHQVVKQCEKVLVKQPPSIHNLILADKFSLTELRNVCIGYVKEIQYNKLEDDPEFKMVDKDTVSEVFQHKLRLHEGKDPLTNVVRRLISEPPSITNLFLAEKHDVPEVYEKCLKYVRDTPLSQLKQEEGFTNLNVDTLNKVLTDKNDTLHTELSKIAKWEVQKVVCSCGHYRSTNGACPECVKYRCRAINHERGTDSSCCICHQYKFDELSEAVKKC